MSALDAVILGIIQGLTEFLPVSSSGHLEIVKFLLGDESLPKDGLLFTVFVHGATALSTLVVFRKEVAEIIKGLFAFQWNDSSKFSLKIIISMIPAALVGLFFESQIEHLFNENILLIGLMLCVTAALLIVADTAKKTVKEVSNVHAVGIGIAQAIAILPGISRSGATIATSVLLGIDRERAARFSFLMVVPLIFGSIAKSLLEGDLSSEETSFIPLLVGFIAAFTTGVLACKWMILLVKKSSLRYFGLYCALVGLIAIIFSID